MELTNTEKVSIKITLVGFLIAILGIIFYLINLNTLSCILTISGMCISIIGINKLWN